ncbi:murein hydrolase activator EnvC family protein [Massilia sp. GCM10020059]|uniref:Peptidoglycan DD-metalloendopeptidase family protein n=1 Tax=Massilia agrisoli TaxID=2892444 RepID=A0ABS8IS47_9BURK|nr:peptidoglycan DD-metalloendopeptidase family protein [Massilia agrisoli]MCC6070706.1 peptidoglycan DD-metalloendopeptidase family protein [Massilia agrisoli]
MFYRRAVATAALLAVAASLQAAPKQPTNRSKQKAAAEATRAGIQKKLATLKRDVVRTESEREHAADELAASEEAISDANRSLRELAEEQQQTNRKLQELDGAQERLAATIAKQKNQLSRLLREQYVAGNEDRVKLLLSGENPNRISRDLQLMAYVSKSQARLIASLRSNLATVEQNQLEVQNAKDELEEIALEENQQKAKLEKEKLHRKALLGNLSTRLADQRKQIGNLERDEQRMSGLVDRLSALIQQQAEAAAAEKRRREALAAARAKARAEARAAALAKAQAERERLAREAARPGSKPAPVKPEPDEPKVAQAPVEDKPDPDEEKPENIALAPAAPEGAFASLKGKLRAPVSGAVTASFGAKRGSGPSWKGVFIKAPEGSDVRAVAAGRVVFASWLRGFGNLIIVDHGSQYLSIYGNNQSLLKRVGDAVRGGDQIAAAGNTGGIEESGLYFELRHRGKAFNPAGWVNF